MNPDNQALLLSVLFLAIVAIGVNIRTTHLAEPETLIVHRYLPGPPGDAMVDLKRMGSETLIYLAASRAGIDRPLSKNDLIACAMQEKRNLRGTVVDSGLVCPAHLQNKIYRPPQAAGSVYRIS